MAITFKPKIHKRKKKHGFLARMRTPWGKRVLSRRRRKERVRLSP